MNFTCPLLMELIWTNGKHDSGTKLASPQGCIPFAPTVNKGDARYAKPIYSLSYRSIVWSLLCYCLRARDHCYALSDVTRDLLFTRYIYLHQPWTDRFVHTNSKLMVKYQRSTQGLLLRIRHTRSYIGLSTTARESNPENQTWWVKIWVYFLLNIIWIYALNTFDWLHFK